MSQSLSWGKVGIVALIVTVLIGGAAGYYVFFFNVTERALKAGERSLAAGDEVFADDPSAAARRYEEAVLQASKVLDDIDRQLGSGIKSQSESQRLGFLQSRALWLKARALRDRAFASAAADGKPIGETTDGTLGGTFRNFLSIPDAKDRAEALRCLRLSGLRLQLEEAVQNEALRTETMLSPVNWRLVEQFSKQALHLDENDTRALYQMALLHYEQAPVDAKGNQGPPPPLEKRSAKRMKESRDYLEKAGKTKNAKYWRMTEMQARITRWLRDHGPAGGDEYRKENERLKAILKEAREKAAADEKALAGLVIFDARGVLALHQMMLEEDARTALKDESAARAAAASLDRVLALCAAMSPPKASRALVEECAKTSTAALSAARPSLPAADAAWDAKLAQAEALAERARDAGTSRPEMYVALVRLLEREAYLASRKGDKTRQKKNADAAEKWLQEGRARGKKAGLAPEQMADLLFIDAERKARAGGGPKLKARLDALRKFTAPQARALTLFLEGVSLEREGRLAAAVRRFEESDALSPGTRTDAALASLYLSLGRPKEALARLPRLLAAYKKLDDLTEQERAWAAEFMRSREDLQLQYITASLDQALQNVAAEVAREPGRPVPASAHEPLHAQALKGVGELPAGSPQARTARLAFIRYHAALRRKAEAARELAAFEKAFPGDADALRHRVAVALLPEPGVKDDVKAAAARREAADGMIRAHLKANPSDFTAKLFWASWLSQTGRAAEAVAFLKDPANTPDGSREEYRRALALALVASGDRAGGAEVLRQLPSSAAVDVALVSLASSADRDKRLSEALARHERDGMVRCIAGAVDLQKGKFAEAAESFFQALEYTQARRAAEQGLQRALVAYAAKDPKAARERMTKMIADLPDEKTLYLAYAYAALLLDDLGQPFQSWENVRNMVTALRMWEGLLKDPRPALLTKAEFWRLAGRADLALDEARRGLAIKDRPPPPEALALGAELAIAAGGDALGEAEAWVAALEKALPDSPAGGLLRARLLARSRKPAEALKAAADVAAKFPTNEAAHALHAELAFAEKGDGAASAVAAWRAKLPESAAARAAAIRLLARGGKAAEAKALAEETHTLLMKRYDEAAAKRKAPEGVAAEEWKKRAVAEREARARDLRVELARPLLLARAYKDAAAVLDGVLSEAPTHAAALLFAGEAALALEDWKAARGYYERLLKAVPGDGVASNNLAWLLAEKLGEAEKARAVLEPLLTGARSGKPLPGDRLPPDVLDTAGLVYRGAKDPAGLERLRLLLAEGRRRYPDDPRLALHLGHAHAALEDHRKAREMYQAAARLAGAENSALDGPARAALAKEAEAAQKKLPD